MPKLNRPRNESSTRVSDFRAAMTSPHSVRPHHRRRRPKRRLHRRERRWDGCRRFAHRWRCGRAIRHSIGKIGVVAMLFSRYVALGDSFTEGGGDPHPTSPNGLRGWADHVAVALTQHNPDLRYANLAVRGRRMDEILADQLQNALMLEPDLVMVYAGMNDLLLVRNDIDAMMARYADALKTLQQTGAHVLAFTAGDLGAVPLFRRLRGRAAVYNELLRAIADDLGLQLVDFWRFTEFRDPRLW